MFLSAVSSEAQVRNVRWYVKDEPRLGLTHAQLEATPLGRACTMLSPRERVEAVFQRTEVSRQLILFQTFFLREFGRLSRESQALKYDAWRGRPTPAQEAEMQVIH